MSDARIREFYQFVAALWPIDTDYRGLLPTADTSLRALYLGEYEPELMQQNVFRFSLYADQIILINPFDNPNLMAEQFNPVVNPGEWRLQTLRLVYHLRILAPWIAAGVVLVGRALATRTVPFRGKSRTSAELAHPCAFRLPELLH